MKSYFSTTALAGLVLAVGALAGCEQAPNPPATRVATAPANPAAGKIEKVDMTSAAADPATMPSSAAPAGGGDAISLPSATTMSAIAPAASTTTPVANPSAPTTAGSDVKSAPAAATNTEWNQWGGSPARNNTPPGKNIPSEWKVGGFDLRTGDWKPEGSKNIKWVAKLGSQSYGNPVVGDGKIFVGSNNGGAWLKRYPVDVDLGVLLCFDLKDGKFLWQDSNEKLPTGRVHDWPEQGVCSAALVEGKRLWYISNRGEIRCLDTEGFHDGENNGPYTQEELDEKEKQADVIWSFDMMKELKISQHNMCACSLTSVGDNLFVCTSNGVDFEHNYIPAPDAPSFVVMNKNTKEILWTDNAPGQNILHGQWSSPAYGVFGGQEMVIFAGGDGWLRAYDPKGDGHGKAKMLWEFDANPKTSFYTVSGRATRNHLIGTPVIYEGLVYVAVGEDPEHGEGIGHLWCIDPTKRGDVSAELAFNAADRSKPLPHRRLQAVDEKAGEIAVANPNSAAIWHYSEVDQNGNGKIEFEETMHRTVGSVTIKDGILYIADFSGLFHCLDAKTGKVNWTFDLMSQTWGSPLVVDGKVYIGDDDGNVSVFKHSANPTEAMKDVDGEKQPFYGKYNMSSSVLSTPVVVNNILYIANKRNLFAIENKGEN